ncbi:Uncharacterised protein [Enterobacter cloacae]|nr:Uncharacterised protein [Enterobacter cloacae]
MAIAHFQRDRFDWRPAYAAVSFHIVLHAVVQAVWRHITFTKHVNAVRQRNVNTAANRERHTVIAFFRANIDGFRASVQHHRTHFQVVACPNAAGLGAVIGVFQPVALRIQAR